ncbi:MAG: DNA repair protein RecO [Cyanothece sp. SIO1E1]|nr:DNA repair protein RecO [Cyanothece sp. SIO1E1]
MSRTYKATGINLKGMPLGESDRLLTILTPELGLIRAVAPGARKHHSKLSGRSGLFVINQLLMIKGKNLDKVIQAETIRSYPGLSQDLGRLTASQYLAELVLCQALSEQSQTELFSRLEEYLGRLERIPKAGLLPWLAYATFQLLVLAGLEPRVSNCCITQQPLMPDFETQDWRVGFSVAAGGIVQLSELAHLDAIQVGVVRSQPKTSTQSYSLSDPTVRTANEAVGPVYRVVSHPQKRPKLNTQLTAVELSLLQQLVQPERFERDLSELEVQKHPLFAPSYTQHWLVVERALRQYAQYHFEQPIRSAVLVDTCFVYPHTSV